MKKRLLSVFLAVAMMFSVMVVAVSAVDDTAYVEGVTAIADPDSPTGYIARFVYRNAEAENVQISSGLMSYVTSESQDIRYTPYEWEPGMFATGFPAWTADMTKAGDDLWTIDVPLPSGAIAYEYLVDGVKTYDPANPPLISVTGRVADYSMCYMPFDAEKQTEDRSNRLPYEGEYKGQTITRTYMDGETERALTIYLPYNWDAGREEPYKVVYISHGGGGDELDWHNDGAVTNIMDNLIAKGITEPAIVVAMNNTDFGWDQEEIARNQFDNIMPLMENEYNASSDPDDRAYCGLSMGGITTSNMYVNYADEFGYLGVWSAAETGFDLSQYEGLEYPNLLLAGGCYDFGLPAVDSFGELLDAEGIDYSYYVANGGHSWNVWQDVYEKFAADILWKNDFDIVTEVFAYGQDATAVVIDLNRETVNAGDIDVDTFAVNAVNYRANGAVAFEGARQITDAYVNNSGELGEKEDSGRYIVLELEHGFNVPGATTHYYTGLNYYLDMDYTVTQLEPVNGEINEYYNENTHNLIVDDFDIVDYEDTFFRVYIPEDAEGPLPVVVWNHGAGETYGGTNEGMQIVANMGGTGWVKNAPESCIVIAPQRGNGTNFTEEKLISYIEGLVESGIADNNRVYVSGCSAGGGQTLSFLRNYPDFFAAAVPICPAGSLSAEQAAEVADLPMYFVHAANDPTINVQRTRDTVALIEEQNPYDLRYGEYESVVGSDGVEYPNGHWSWIMVLDNDNGIMDWVFSQKKSSITDYTASAETYGDITITANTRDDIIGFRLLNENGRAVTIKSAVSEADESGRLTWTITTSVGTAGARNLSLVPISETSGAITAEAVNVEVVETTTSGDVLSAEFDVRAARVNSPFGLSVVSESDVNSISVTNENGGKVGKTLVARTINEDGTLSWSYELSVGTAGDRTFTISAPNGSYATAGIIIV